jgi:transcriptional regulator of acetoin/glycerol metabolism
LRPTGHHAPAPARPKGGLAREIHRGSERRRAGFVAVNCAAFPETLLESEIFGHVRGSLTGAERDKQGLFEVADRGTLLLDEVGETSAPSGVRRSKNSTSFVVWPWPTPWPNAWG